MATNKDKLIAGAQKLVEKGQFDKAIKEYLRVVQQDDKDVRIWLKIGDLYAKLGKKAEASETYQKVAEFYSEQGFYLKSVAVYKQILKIDPRLVDVNQRLAELYKQLGLLSDAMQQYETVAAFWHKEGKTREALAALKQIVELDPETVANRIKLAELYSKEQMPREAIDEFTKAAEQLKAQGRTDDYMKVAERLLFHSPDNRPVTKELARLYIEKGDPRRALPKLQVSFKADARDTEVLGLLAKAFEALEQRAKSVSVLKELARILAENGDRQARDEVYRKILTLTPGDAEAEQALGTGPLRKTDAPPPRPSAFDRPQTGPGVPAPTGTGGRPVVLGASWPPPAAVVEDAPENEFDDVRGTGVEEVDDEVPKPATVKPLQPQPQTSVGRLLDAGDAAPSGGDGEEVARILNETDVYIKYKLYAKAIEHVQRVFEHDPRHVEAREKLKALYLTVGKRDEAVLELWALSEQAEPGRQRRYLREILELDPAHTRAAALLGEDAAPAPRKSAGRGEGPGDELLDVEDLEELNDEEFEVADPSKNDIELPIRADADDAGTFNSRVPEDDPAADDDDDLIPLVVDSGERPKASDDVEEVEDRFGFGDDADAAAEEDRFSLDASSESIEEDVPALPVTRRQPTVDQDVNPRFDDQAVKFLNQEALFGKSEEIDDEDLPPVAGLRQGTATVPSASLPKDFAETPPPAPAPTRPNVSADALRTHPGGAVAFDDETSSGGGASRITGVTAPAVEERSESSFEDDLDEADFFVQQSLFDEARAILETLLARHPGHPLVGAKLRDLATLEGGSAAGPPSPESLGAQPEEAVSGDISAQLPEDLPGAADAAPASEEEPAYEMTRRGVIEKGVTAEDFETHYDLGIAYKEMGLLDDAIAEFKLVMKDPPREVQCHLMIGLCCLEKGMQTEAIGHFKKGLYVEGITDRESLSLYFELGQAYERLGDPREALYYYEKVVKRDPRFRNVEKLVEGLRPGGTPAAGAAPAGSDGDVDAAFDTLLGSGDT